MQEVFCDKKKTEAPTRFRPRRRWNQLELLPTLSDRVRPTRTHFVFRELQKLVTRNLLNEQHWHPEFWR